MGRYRFLFAVFLTCHFCAWGLPQDNQLDSEDNDPISMLGDKYQNSIPLLQNRFRIDYQVDEVSMVFFRTFGSSPVVLVKPDGSKLFQSRVTEDVAEWVYSANYDAIKLKNPTPGPWQAMGQILPGSRVMIMSDIELHVPPLPEIMFSGEIMKQTGRLTNGGEPIEFKEFRDVVDLSIKFISTNNPNYDNFGANDGEIATFKDDGRGMDERPRDGVFTGQYDLTVGDGEWIPVFVVNTPLYNREQYGDKILVLENPVHISVDKNEGNRGYHELKIDADRQYVDINSLLIDGKVRFPNGDVQNFSITDPSDQARLHRITHYEYGIFRVKITVYGNTYNGRNFILDVPEYSFLIEEPELKVAEPVTPDAAAGTQVNNPQTVPSEQRQNTPTPMPQQEDETPVWLIIGINLFLLLIGGLVLWFIFKPAKTDHSQSTKVD
ncbi:TIGR03503 family protein [Neptunicella sp. SCSIO 80796]|uniref:TIGR03503 family protein n=1 Tax=Neptunicella plasticusilytica TaxID=3117012 RepID=UPI003A4D37AF